MVQSNSLLRFANPRPGIATAPKARVSRTPMRFRDAPTSVVVLARVLGYDASALAGLRETHGERLLIKLQREWWGIQDRPRLLHRDSSHGYTESTSQSISALEPEAVSAEYQEELSTEGRKRYLLQSRSAARERRERLRQVESKAMKDRIDISPHLAAIEARIRMIENELEQAA